MANMYNLPEDLPTVTRQNYYEPSVQVENPTPPVPRRGYTPQDYERHRPAMIQRTAQKYLAPNGDFDQEGFNKEVVQNMYSAGDINGVRDFVRSQKENEVLQRASNKDTMDFVGNQAYSFSKTVEDIKSKQGEQAAQAYVQKYYPMLRTTMSKAGYGDYMSPEYDHDAAKLLGRQWATSKGKEFGDGMEVLSTPQLYTNPKNSRQEMWYFDKAGNPKSFVRTANKKDLEGGKSSGLTLTQQAHNDEIDTARTELDNMELNKSEIQKRTKQFSATGRTNPDYDPQISKVVSLATKRKVGEDAEHKKYYANYIGSGGEQKPATTPSATGLKATGRQAKDTSGAVYSEMSDGSWRDKNGNPFKGK